MRIEDITISHQTFNNIIHKTWFCIIAYTDRIIIDKIRVWPLIINNNRKNKKKYIDVQVQIY